MPKKKSSTRVEEASEEGELANVLPIFHWEEEQHYKGVRCPLLQA